jgi:pimeloyl-ACP methyl ester carboxylesterase
MRATFSILIFLLAGCSPGIQQKGGNQGSSSTDAAAPESAFAEVNGVELHYLDWGGEGPPVVMVHGMGDSPHVFDDVAAELRDDFRIVAYARRGHGQSDAPRGPYHPATLVEDLRQLLDHLEIRRASLVGWSMGGNEISDFAGRFPNRTDKLVYLDGGYDWSDPTFMQGFIEMLALTSPTAADVRSLDAFRSWYQETWLGFSPWSAGLEAYLRDITRIAADGSVSTVPDEEVTKTLLATLRIWRRDYTSIAAPVLALYATVFFPTGRADLDLRRKLRQFELEVMLPFRRANVERLQRELPGATVHQIENTTHMSIGVHEPKALAATIREFLLGRRASL